MTIIWNELSKKQIDNMLNETIKLIFFNYDIAKMTKYEKRKRIYEYLVCKKKYNEEYFSNILKNYIEKDPKKRFSRNLMEEFLEPLISDKGICNGFSQIYKLLLEKVGIYSICINCMIKHNNQFVGHQLNLVYDEETNTFSFDDVTFGIIKQDKEEYFDYDDPNNKEELQGYAPLYNDIKWMAVEDDLINYYAKRQNSIIEKPNNIRIDEIILQELSGFKSKGITIKPKREFLEQRVIK